MKAKAAIGDVVLRAMLILGLVFGLAPLAKAQMMAAKGKPAAAKTKSPASAKPSGGPQEGIKVHGHWTIVVRDLDGKEVTRREFENALTDVGKEFLARLLARQLTVGEWGIQLEGPNGAIVVRIFEPTFNQTVPGISKTLTVNLIPTPGGASVSVELKGDSRALVSSAINQVQALTITGPGMIINIFTSASLPSPVSPSPVSVVAGQLVEVTVILSFS